jgi:hypothetical protein
MPNEATVRGAFTKRDVTIDPDFWEDDIAKFCLEPDKQTKACRIPNGTWSALVTWDALRLHALYRPGEPQALLSVDPATKEVDGQFELVWRPK